MVRNAAKHPVVAAMKNTHRTSKTFPHEPRGRILKYAEIESSSSTILVIIALAAPGALKTGII